MAKKIQNSEIDLIVSFFNETAFRNFKTENTSLMHLHFKNGGKWTGIFDALVRTKKNYDYYFFPDDDLEISLDSVSRLFETMGSLQASVGQPSLDHQSYFSHLITLHHPKTMWRKTNFVEVMAPCLSSELLKIVLPYFETTESGFGLDYAWCMSPISRESSYIFDSIQIHHPRPIGTQLKHSMKSLGRPKNSDEWSQLNQVLGIDGKQVPLVHEILTERRQLLRNRLLRILHLAIVLKTVIAPRGLLEFSTDRKRYLKRQLVYSRDQKNAFNL